MDKIDVEISTRHIDVDLITRGIPGPPGIVQSVVAGTNVTVDSTDPANPIVNASGGGGGLESVQAGTGIDVDATDPLNPIVSVKETFASFMYSGVHANIDYGGYFSVMASYGNNSGQKALTAIAGGYSFRVPKPGTFKNFFMTTGNAPGDGNQEVFVIFLNGVATSLAVTVAGSDTQAQDESNTVAVVRNDIISCFYGAPSSGNINKINYTIEFQPSS